MGFLSKAASKVKSTVRKGVEKTKKTARKALERREELGEEWDREQKRKKNRREVNRREKPILDEEDFEESRDLEDLGQRYRREGIDFDQESDIYRTAKDDWWELKKDYDPVEFSTIPHDEYEINVNRDGRPYNVTLNVAGIAHGQKHFARMNKEVRDYLRDEVDEISEDGYVLFEDGFDDVVFDNYFEYNDRVEELDDRRLLGHEEKEDETSALWDYTQKYLAGPVIDSIFSLTERLGDGRGSSLTETARDALKEPEQIQKLQNFTKATKPPLRFRQDYRDARVGKVEEAERYIEEEIERRQEYEPEGILDSLKNSYYLSTLKIGRRKIKAKKGYEGFKEVAGWERSKYMANEAARKGLEKNEDEVWLVIGAEHHADIDQYLEEEDPSEIFSKPLTLKEFIESPGDYDTAYG